MKYIIMCGGVYPSFKKPKQLLKENSIKDIAICTNSEDFNYLGLPILHQENKYVCGDENENKKSEYSWLNAYYPTDEPCCYLHGDVYFSPDAIRTIVNTEVKETMFFCTFDWSDGEKDRRNYKGREPFAYKVENQKVFREAIEDLMRMTDQGKFENGLPPICWQLYRYINKKKIDFQTKDWTKINNIFQESGDYIVINDYTTDVDHPEDVEVLEEWLKK